MVSPFIPFRFIYLDSQVMKKLEKSRVSRISPGVPNFPEFPRISPNFPEFPNLWVSRILFYLRF